MCLCRQLQYLTIVLVAASVAAWRFDGVLPAQSEFAVYVGKFAYDYDPDKKPVGTLSAEVQGVVQHKLSSAEEEVPLTDPEALRENPEGRLFLVTYSDERKHWARIREFWDELTCRERMQYASWFVEITSSENSYWTTSTSIRQGLRPRFWYFAFVNCGADIAQPMPYMVRARNLQHGFQAEFSLDNHGAIPLDATFSVLFFLTAATSWLALALRETGPSAAAQMLFYLQLSAACSAIGCGLRLWHHSAFAQSGVGIIQVQLLGTICSTGAKVLFTVFMAKGWSLLSPPTDDERGQPAIFCALFAAIGLSVACEVHEQYFHDKSTEIRLYDSWTGEIILMLNLGLLASACWLGWEAYRFETLPSVRQLARRVSSMAGIYFATLPVLAVLALVLEPWVRRKYIERLELFTRWLATAMLLFILHPSRSEDVVVAAKVRRRQKQTLKQRRRGV